MPTGMIKEITGLSILEIILIIAIAWFLLRFVQWFLPWLATQAPSRLRLHLLPLMPIFQLLIVVLAIVNIIPLIIEPTPENFLAISGAVAIAVGFAFQDYISSLVAGIVTIYERPYRVGDWIKIGEAYGEVTAVHFRAVELVTPDDTVVLIPHKNLWDTTIYNDNNGQREHMCVADFYLHPEHDAEEVRQKLRKVALTSPYLQLKRPIVVIVHERPWGTHYRLKAYPIDGRDQFKFTSDLTVRGEAALAQLDVRPAVAPQAVI
ncbi:MAG TPA: mechanosensitive ion channel [Anaerolineae bacterium]|nr:mechanosensitive ion channel [Anaerolineae bacterium]